MNVNAKIRCTMVFLMMMLSGVATAQAPQIINYQGLLTDPATGQPVADDTYEIVFSIYDVSTGGAALWTETHNITTKNGLYSASLGSTTPITSTILNGAERYLGIKVGNDNEMTPRKRLVSVAYAIMSSNGGSSPWDTSGNDIFYNNGNVGIGTIFPSSKLDVWGSADLDRNGIINANVSNGNPNPTQAIAVRAQLHGNPSDTGGMYDAFTAIDVDNGGGSAQYFAYRVETGYTTAMQIQSGTIDYISGIDLTFTNGSSDVLTLKNNGNVGIGTTGPTAQLHTTGSVRFANFGAGTLQTDANGNVSVSSDARLKKIKGNFDRGLSAILQIDPINYTWKQESGLDTESTYTGFSAQNVQDVIPEAVHKDKSGYLTLSDRPIIAALVNAVKELRLENEHLRQEIEAIKGAIGK